MSFNGPKCSKCGQLLNSPNLVAHVCAVSPLSFEMKRAVEMGNMVAVQILFKNAHQQNKDIINDVDLQGQTALHIAAQQKNNQAIIELMVLAEYADLSLRDKAGNTAFDYGKRNYPENSEVMGWLKGDTLLHKDCLKGDHLSVKEGIDNQEDILDKNYQGVTPLHIVLARGFIKCAEILLSNSALVLKALTATNNAGQTPTVTNPLKRQEFVNFLKHNKVRLGLNDPQGETIIASIQKLGYVDMANVEFAMALKAAMMNQQSASSPKRRRNFLRRMKN